MKFTQDYKRTIPYPRRVVVLKILNGKRIKDFVGLREIVLFVGAFLITSAVTLVGYYMPVNVMPNLALCPVIGLLFGPFASLGVNLVSLIENINDGNPLSMCVIEILTVFLVSYIPYRLWYSTWMDRDARPPVLDSVRNIVKFVLMMMVSSLVYTVLYNITYGIMDGVFVLDFEDMVRFINVMSFSFLFGMAAILLLRYLGVKFYTPKYGGTPDDFRRKVKPRFYDLLLVLGLVLPALVLEMAPEGPAIPAMAILTYVLLIAFLLKPMEQARAGERTVSFMGIRINKFNSSLIERIIVMFIVSGLVICLLAGLAAYLGILEDVFGWGFDVTVLFYMGLGMIIFFIPAIMFLWYIETRVTEPISKLSDATRDLISDEHEFSSEEFSYRCKDVLLMDSEIGDLARSLSKMTVDMEEYLTDIRSLNSQQEKYRAELNVAKNIQESFVPTNFSSIEGTGASVAAIMEAAKYVGGDFYDFYMIDTDHLAVTIGDVSGKGVPAALFMAVTKYLIEGQSRPGLTPGEIMSKVNLSLCRNNDENMFVTVWLGILELATGRFAYCSAGHNPPIITRAGGDPEVLETKPSLVLGAREGVKYNVSETVLNPGDRVLLYTDGVTEANDHYNGFYGMERLMDVLGRTRENGLTDQISSIYNDIMEFTNNSDQFDDITMLNLRYEGTSGKPLLDDEDVAPPVTTVTDAVDVLLDKEDS